MAESATSQLIPPNPSLSNTKPSGSILLNREDRQSQDQSRSPPLPGNTLFQNVKGVFSFDGGVAGKVHESAIRPAASPRGGEHQLGLARSHSSSSSASVPVFSPVNHYSPVFAEDEPEGSRSGHLRSSSVSSKRSSISFAPLPHVPELERRRSITLGVAARSNLLRTQGSAATPRQQGIPRGRSASGGYLVMNDQEWAEYQAKMSGSGDRSDDPPPLHQFVKAGTKSLWKRARSLSSSSKTSSSDPSDRSPSAGRSPSLRDVGSIPSPRSKTIPSWVESVPEQAVEDDGASDLGSVKEEGMLEDEESEVDDGLSAGAGLDNGGPMEGIEEEDEEPFGSAGSVSSDGGDAAKESPSDPIPSYLRQDLSAERRHYAHLPPEHKPNSYRTSDLDTPTGTPRRRLSNDMQDGGFFGPGHLSKKLEEMDLKRGGGGEGGSGDVTPRVQRSPKLQPTKSGKLPSEITSGW